jgi:hypothetical protein
MKNLKTLPAIINPESEFPNNDKNGLLNGNALFDHISTIIESRKSSAGAYANREVTLMYWEIGHYINSIVINGKRAEYGKRILTELAAKLVYEYVKSFTERNLYRIALFAERFYNVEILPPLAAKLSWSHIIIAGIAVAEYWTHLPPKKEFETKIKTILIEARERLERRKSLPVTKIQKQRDYFFESKDDDSDEA